MNLLTRLRNRAERRHLEDDWRLLMAFHPGEKLHGLEIRDRTGLRSGRMYPALARAERRGRLDSGWDDGPEPRRRFYFLTVAGERDRMPQVLP